MSAEYSSQFPLQAAQSGVFTSSLHPSLCGLRRVCKRTFPVFVGTDHGLEWGFRLCQEPRRLWKRYVRTNLPFLWVALNEQLKQG
ncbi:MAG TPA: hypothetical protein V6C82_07030 [Chroococcales cyanobacterium]|jgi:hypothetical protein